MHIIPQSWSHLHILVSVFPPLGLLFGLGLYIAGSRKRDGFTRRIWFVLAGLLGVLAVPIYVSGAGSMATLSGNPRFTEAAINAHYRWGLVALAVLVLGGAAAGIVLWRSWRARGPAGDPLHVVLGLAIAALVLTVVAGELGFAINHRELELAVTIPDISTPQIWSHVHIIVNHIPTAGIVFALAFFGAALVANNDVLKRISLTLFVICAIAGVPTYVAGTAAMWALTQPPIPDLAISKAMINAHRDMALWTLVGLAFTGGGAWIELWRSRYRGRFSPLALNLVLLFAIVTLGIMTETGHRGGLINHPEIRLASEIVPGDDNAGVSVALENAVRESPWFLPWQIVHFFGYSLIFAAAAAVGLRVLGFWKSASFAAMHRLLVLGFVGVLMNVVSGMFMMLTDSYRYVVSDVAFAPKIAFLALGAIAVLYFSVSERLWNVQAGQDATATAKWVAVVVVVAWAVVIICGRLLPYL